MIVRHGDALRRDGASGVLVIGDQHVSSSRPGRRREEDWPGPIMRKLERCVAVANERNLVPVLLGDLFDRCGEDDLPTLSRLIRLLRRFDHRPVANTGNHDIRNTRLAEGDTLEMMAGTDVLDVVAEPAMPLRVAGVRYGFIPYGFAIPDRCWDAAREPTVWFTHHDIAIGETFPGAVPPHPVDGVDLVVNGHVHMFRRPLPVGRTLWFQPGAIVRKSVDVRTEKPRAWALVDMRLTPVDLPHTPGDGAFDLTGRIDVAGAAANLLATHEEQMDIESAFVTLLKAQDTGEMDKMEDGAGIKEIMEAKMERDQTPPQVASMIWSLFDEATKGEAA